MRGKFGSLCWIRRMSQDGTQIKPSTIGGAGLDLFAARDFKKNPIVARYTGDLVNTEEGEDDDGGFEGSSCDQDVRSLSPSRSSGTRSSCPHWKLARE